MDSTLLSNKIFIPDILPSRTISDAVASLRISQFKVGQQITRYIHEQYTRSSQNQTGNEKPFIPGFAKIERLANDTNIILIGGDYGLRVWKNSTRVDNISQGSETELILEKINNRSIDASMAVFSTVSQLCIVNLSSQTDNADEHQIVLYQPDKSEVSKKFSGQAIKISSSRSYILVSLAVTSIRLLHPNTLEQITVITSISGIEVIYASSLRWLAVQVSPQGILNQGKETLSNEGDISTIISAGNAARRVVSGFYSFSKASWNTITPLIQKVCQNPPLNTTKIKSDNQLRSVFPFSLTSDTTLTGGAVAIWDMNSTSSQQPVLIKKFLAHRNNLSCMSFSPSGLRLISADTNGQVILVHALCSSGMLPSPPYLFTSTENIPGKDQMYPLLLFKLVRGITLANISTVGLDPSENIAFVTSTNGTMHIFDLCHSSTSMRSRSSSMSTATSLSPISPSPSTALHENYLPITTIPMLPPSICDKQLQSTSPTTWPTMTAIKMPAQDISQLLQLHPTLGNKMNTVKQLHSDLKISLPLLPFPCSLTPSIDKNENNCNNNNNFTITASTTTMKSKVDSNMTSHTNSSTTSTNSTTTTTSVTISSVNRLDIHAVLFRYKSQVSYIPPTNSSFGSTPLYPLTRSETGIEILAVTSEGLLCRYRAPYDLSLQPPLQPVAGTASMLPHTLSLPSNLSAPSPSPSTRVYQEAKEINRWDLTTNIETLTANKEIEEGTLSSTIDPSPPLGYVTKLRQTANKHPVPVTATQRWLMSVSDRHDCCADLPYWLRPQITLKKHLHSIAVVKPSTEAPSTPTSPLLDFSIYPSEDTIPPTSLNTTTINSYTSCYKSKNTHIFTERIKTETLIIRRPIPYLVQHAINNNSDNNSTPSIPSLITATTTTSSLQQQQQHQLAIMKELKHAIQSELPTPASYDDDPWTKQHYFINELLYPQKYGVLEEFSDDFCDRWDTDIDYELPEKNPNNITSETKEKNTLNATIDNNNNNNNVQTSVSLEEKNVNNEEDDLDDDESNNYEKDNS